MEKDLKRLVRVTNCKVKVDISMSNGDRVLRREGRRRFKVIRRLRPGIKTIEEHVRKNDCAAIVSYSYFNQEIGDYFSHCMLYIDVSPSGKTFTCVNYNEGSTVAQFRRSTIIGDLRSHFVNYPHVWFLTRLNN